jgi:ABC-type nickel/cobalt efflux system permease component RcnA
MNRTHSLLGVIALGLIALTGALLLIWPSLFNDTLAFIVAQQQAMHRSLTSSVTELKREGSLAAVLGLSALSFAYGIFHALGPGHGKAVIGSYLVASGDTVRRGIALAFVSSIVQGLMAILLVSILIVALGMTAKAATANVSWLELASYLLMTGAGAYLLYRKTVEVRQPIGATAGHHHHHHDHDEDCGHGHMPSAAVVAKPLGFASLAGIVGAIGIRPCMGAVLVLVFALSHGLLTAGITAVLAMSIGTAITVSALAILTVMARGEGVRTLVSNDSWFATIHHGLGFVGALALLVMGALFFIAALQAPAVNPLGMPG